MGGSFWEKDSLITHILFELRMPIMISSPVYFFWYTLYFFQSTHQVGMKNVVECYKEFFGYFNALETNGAYSMSSQN